MADPPPEAPSGLSHPPGDPLLPPHPAGHPLTAGIPPPPLQPTDQPHAAGNPHLHLLPESPESSSPGVPDSPGDQPPLAMEPARPPLAELNPNGGSLHSKSAMFMKAPPSRPSMGVPLRKIKKKKNPTKGLPYHLLSSNETVEKVLSNETVKKVLKKAGPRVSHAAVVQPLQAVEADDVSIADEDDEWWSDEEEEFDLEDFLVDEEKKAELKCLMEKYEVYDEEQLRLAIRRERKQRKSENLIAGVPSRSSESAPVSPSGKASGFIPPCGFEFPPRSPIISPEISMPDVAAADGNSNQLSNSPPPNPPTTIPMHNPPPPRPFPISMHNPPPPLTSAMQTPPPHNTMPMHSLPRPTPHSDVDNPPPITHDSHATTHVPHIPGPDIMGLGNPIPTSPNPKPISIISPAHPTSSAQPDTPTPSQPMHQALLTGGQLLQDQALSFFSNNPLATGDLADFPPLPKGSMAPANSGNEDTVMVPVDDRHTLPNRGPGQSSSPSCVEQVPSSAPALPLGPPPLLRSGSKIPPLPRLPSPSIPPSTLPLEPRGSAKVHLLFRLRKLTRNVSQVALGSPWSESFRTPSPPPTTSTKLSTTSRSEVLLRGIS